MNTDTPRTDELEVMHDLATGKLEFVSAEFTRQLERELAAEKEKVRELREALKSIAKGYSGDYGNAQGLSGTDCAEIARAILEKTK